MKHIFGNMKKYWVSVVIILGLLIAQAFCDFALPTYTSDLIDTGITNDGVAYATPTQMTATTYLSVAMIMTDEEQSLWKDAYETGDNGDYYLKDGMSQEKLDETFVKPIAAYYMMMQMMSQQGGDKAFDTGTMPTDRDSVLAMRTAIDEQLDKLGDSMVSSYAIAFTKQEYTAVGINLDKMRTAYLWKMGGFMILFALGMAAISVAVGYLASKVAAGVGRDLRKKIFAKVVNFSDAEIGKFSTASLITRTTNDVQQIQQVTVLLLRMIMYAPIMAIFGIVKVVGTGAGMGYIIVIGVAAIACLMAVLMAIAMPRFKIMQKLVDKVNLISREILTGLPVIRAFSREKHEEKRFDDANKELTGVMLFTNRVMTFMMPVLMIIMNAMSVFIVWTAGHRIDSGVMEVGTMTAFITYTMMIVMAFLMLTMVSVMLPRAGVAADRIDEVLKTESTINDKETAVDMKDMKGVVRYDHVNFKFPDAEGYALENIDFEARPGTTTAIIGSTGCGKSTLINLIPRFFDVTEGAITIDGTDVRDISLESLRGHIGYVPQKGVLFSGTIADNIKYGQSTESDEAMYEAAGIAQATDFIEEKPDGYESAIAQGGNNVSGGQKQRLSIARAIARNPQIYIFDDSFSALDFKTDITLRKALGPKVKDKTVFIVAQRISTILYADQILVLDDGRLVGKGTHKELMKTCEVYEQIATSQLSEKELENSLKEVQ